MGVDYGEKRIGIAVSDEGRLIATPHSVIPHAGWGPDIRAIKRLMTELDADYVVLGLPRNADGSEGFQAREVRLFAGQLAASGVRVDFADERYTSLEAEEALIEGGLTRAERKKKVDQVAAALILQAYLNSQRETL